MVSTTTVGDVLTDALQDCGAFAAGMPPPQSAVIKGLRLFNMNISQWNRKRWLIYHLMDTAYAASGAQSYTIGPGGQIQMDPRPDKLEFAFMRQLNASPNIPVDYTLRILPAYEDYARISVKKLQTWCQWVFLDPGFPLGKVYTWPVMQTGFELHLGTKAILQRYASLNQLLGVPEEYELAFYQIMKVRFTEAYRLRTSPMEVQLMKESLNVLRGANSAIAKLMMPRAVRSGRYKYNIYSDDN